MRKLIRDRNLHDIAAAIRTKNGSNGTYKPREMADAIRALPSPSTLVPKAITENGSYSPQSENADGYSSVTVNVGRNLVHKSITRNGSFRAASDHVDGYSSVSVNVPNSYSALDEGKVVSGGALNAQTSRTVTQNGTFDTTRNNQVTVNVSGGGTAESPTLVPLTVTENGTYSPANDNADGYSTVTVSVSTGILPEDEGKVVQNGALTAQTNLNITANGTFDTTAISTVTVNTSGGGSGAIWEYVTPTVLQGVYIAINGSLYYNKPGYENYRVALFDLEYLSGKVIRIDNRGNNRNWWGVYAEVYDGVPLQYPSERRKNESGLLTVYANDFIGIGDGYTDNSGNHYSGRYLMYDFTSSNQNPPTVSVLTP